MAACRHVVRSSISGLDHPIGRDFKAAEDHAQRSSGLLEPQRPTTAPARTDSRPVGAELSAPRASARIRRASPAGKSADPAVR